MADLLNINWINNRRFPAFKAYSTNPIKYLYLVQMLLKTTRLRIMTHKYPTSLISWLQYQSKWMLNLCNPKSAAHLSTTTMHWFNVCFQQDVISSEMKHTGFVFKIVLKLLTRTKTRVCERVQYGGHRSLDFGTARGIVTQKQSTVWLSLPDFRVSMCGATSGNDDLLLKRCVPFHVGDLNHWGSVCGFKLCAFPG